MRYLLLTLLSISLFAAEEEEDIDFEPDLTYTNHTIDLDSGPLSYTAVAGTCPILSEEEKIADLFFIAYIKDGEEDRPLTFVFPGGPGGAGTIEAILTFGPRRLLTPDEGKTVLPSYKLIDNPQTLLGVTDLVFVDPVNCGFSKATPEADLQSIYSVEGDLCTLSDFIHTFIDQSERWNSPIYLAGGSYGSLRCSGLAMSLLKYDIAVKGIILDGCAFDFSTRKSERDHPLPDCLIIPTFAATAWYHERLWPEKPLEEVLDYARRFALEDYAFYMMQPNRLSYVEKLAFEKAYAEIVGLPLDTVRRYNCRINEHIYTSEFFGPERKVIGNLDTRYTGDISTIDPSHADDPSYLDTIGYGPAFNHYLQKELDVHYPLSKYALLSWEALVSWDFGTHDSLGLPSFLQRLRRALTINPHMSIFIGSGYYDCRTPFAATEYCFDHLDLPEIYRKNLQFEYYEAGHGFIFDYESLKKWKADLTRFYQR